MSPPESEIDEVLRALAHPDRRIFLGACFDRPQAAGELARMSQLSLASVSEHLRVLRKVGLLILTKRGRYWYYRTNPKALEAAHRMVSLLIRGQYGS